MSSKRITSAPNWASVIPPSGAAMNAEPSTMRRPARMPVIMRFPLSLLLETDQVVLSLVQPPAVLGRPHLEVGVAAQLLRRMQRPERIEQRLAADGDQVGVTRLQDRLGLLPVEDQADGHGVDVRLALHRRRERHLETQRALDRERRRQAGEAARGTVDHVDAQLLQCLGEDDRVLDLPAAGAVDRRDADEHRLADRPGGAHGACRLERKAHAAGAVATILIVALVADRREELRQQITVRAMDLDDVVACRIGALGSLAEFPHKRRDIVDSELTRDLPAFGRRQFGGADHLPFLPAGAGRSELAGLVEGARRAALAAGMGDLGAGERALLLEEAHQALVTLDLAVVPHAEIALGDPAARLDGAVLGEDDAELAERKLAEMDQVVVVHLPVDGAVLHHGGDDGAIGRGDAAQAERREEKRFLQRSVPRTGWLIGGGT